MPDDDGAHLVYVDLIEEAPLSQDAWYEREGGVTKEGNFWADDAAMEADYRRYLNSFQPWRSVVRSGGNQRTMFRSSERYFNEAGARHAVEVCFGSNSRVFLRRNEHGNVELRQPTS